MKKNLKYLILFAAIIVGIDLMIGWSARKMVKKLSFGFYGNINCSIADTSELLILGSSRAMHHYDPALISRSLNKRCYNAGTGGYGLFLDYAVLAERIRQQNIPQMVILDLSPNTMVIGANSYAKLNKLLPYFDEYPSFRDIVLLDPKYSELEQLFNLYQYNSTLYDIINDKLEENQSGGNGYEGLQGTINVSNFKPFFLEEDEYFDPNKIHYLERILRMCKENNIKIVGLVSPTYMKYDRQDRIINKIDSIFGVNDFRFYDFSDEASVYEKPEFFKDQIHMNNEGTRVFTEKIVSYIIKE